MSHKRARRLFGRGHGHFQPNTAVRRIACAGARRRPVPGAAEREAAYATLVAARESRRYVEGLQRRVRAAALPTERACAGAAQRRAAALPTRPLSPPRREDADLPAGAQQPAVPRTPARSRGPRDRLLAGVLRAPRHPLRDGADDVTGGARDRAGSDRALPAPRGQGPRTRGGV